MEVSFTIPGPPKGKGRPKFSTFGGFARAYTDSKTRSYEGEVKLFAQQAGLLPIDAPCEMEIMAFFPIAKSKTKKWLARLEQGLEFCTSKPDCDNIGKIICDALNGVAYPDDRIIYSLKVSKSFSSSPRVEVMIRYQNQ